LGKTVAVSFEEKSVKILHASLKGKDLFIEDAKIIADEQFDFYLRRERSKEFIVTYDFSESYQGVITTPPVKTAYLEKIVESEIRKVIETRDFSFIYSPIGERVIEQKRIMEVSYFAVRNEELRNVVNRFYENGKVVKALYPRVFSLLPLFKPSDDAILGVSGTETEKTAFLIKKGAIYFVRRFKSLTRGVSDIDIHDINMTVNYCLQSLRISPSLILLAGNLSESYEGLSVAPSLPLTCLYKPQYIRCPVETFNEFITPLASLYAPKSSSILSREFKNIYMLKNYLVNASRLFIISTILCLGALFYEAKNIMDINEQLRLAKKDIAEIEKILPEYALKEAEIKRYMPVVSFLSKPLPEIQGLLIAVGGMETRDAIFNSIDAVPRDDISFLVTINGAIKADTYTAMQSSFKNIIDSLGRIENIKITGKSMDIANKTFSIQMDYKAGEGKK